MKYSLNTFKLYKDESIFAMIMRIRVVMKEKVDVKKLKSAVNMSGSVWMKMAAISLRRIRRKS